MAVDICVLLRCDCVMWQPGTPLEAVPEAVCTASSCAMILVMYYCGPLLALLLFWAGGVVFRIHISFLLKITIIFVYTPFLEKTSNDCMIVCM